MAALIRSSKSHAVSSLSSVSLIRRCFSSAVASELRSPAAPSPFALNHNLPRKDPKDRNVQWVFLGCPGVGKGTYASRLCNLLGIPHIATGDLVREELASSSPLSRQVCPRFIPFFHLKSNISAAFLSFEVLISDGFWRFSQSCVRFAKS